MQKCILKNAPQSSAIDSYHTLKISLTCTKCNWCLGLKKLVLRNSCQKRVRGWRHFCSMWHLGRRSCSGCSSRSPMDRFSGMLFARYLKETSLNQAFLFRVGSEEDRREDWVKTAETSTSDLPGKGLRVCLVIVGVAFVWGCGIMLLLCVAIEGTSLGGAWFESDTFSRKLTF